MSLITQLARKFIPERTRLAWSRSAIRRGYGKDIAEAKRANNLNEVADLESAERFELELQQELEDDFLTSRLLRQARSLRIPIPYIRNGDGSESDLWYEGTQTGGWHLSLKGIYALRQEIRQELKARHESRAQYLVWLTAITGVIGTITGLIAVLQRHG